MRNRITYGYKIRDGEIRIDENQREIVLKIFESYLEGNSIRQVMQELNEAGIPSPNGELWVHGAVGNVLENNRYAGENQYPAIISKEMFEQVQARRQEISKKLGRTAKAEREKPVYNGMVFCGECGRKYWRLHNRERYFWNCNLHYTKGCKENGEPCKDSRNITDAEIQKAYIRLQNRIFDEEIKVKQPLECNPKKLEIWKSKYEEMLGNADCYEDWSIADVIFRIAAEEYAQSRGVEDATIIRTAAATGRTAVFQPENFKRIVRKIIVTKTGLDFELTNGQKIRNV